MTLVLSFPAVMAMVGCMTRGNSETVSVAVRPDDQPIMANQKYVIPASEIPRLEEEALRGSAESAYRLGMFHSMIMLDRKASEYWLTVAAENGSILAMYNLAVTLQSRPDPHAKPRARFWLEQVVKAGESPLAAPAAERLRELGSTKEAVDPRLAALRA